jgi:hypothetical protein
MQSGRPAAKALSNEIEQICWDSVSAPSTKLSDSIRIEIFRTQLVVVHGHI